MNIVLDTNILHQEGLSSRNMLLLSRLSKSSKVSVYIPEIVKREYLSKKIATAREDLSMISGRLDSIKKWIGTNNDIAEEVRKVERIFKKLHQNVEEPIVDSFDQWVSDCYIEIVDFYPDNIEQVLNDYFSGNGVFKKAKNRDDIPDAMIYTIIQDILDNSKPDPVAVVIKDGNFKAHLDTVEGIETFGALSDLFESVSIKILIDELDSESERIESIKKILADEEIQDRFRDYLVSDKSYLDSIYLEGDEIILNEEIGLNFWGQGMDGIETDSIEKVEFGGVNFTDDNSFFIDISFYGNSLLRYAADYSDYQGLPDDRKNQIDFESMNGDGVCELSEKLKFKFSGHIEIWLIETMSPEEFKVHTQYIKTDESVLVIGVSIKSAEIEQHA